MCLGHSNAPSKSVYKKIKKNVVMKLFEFFLNLKVIENVLCWQRSPFHTQKAAKWTLFCDTKLLEGLIASCEDCDLEMDVIAVGDSRGPISFGQKMPNRFCVRCRGCCRKFSKMQEAENLPKSRILFRILQHLFENKKEWNHFWSEKKSIWSVKYSIWLIYTLKKTLNYFKPCSRRFIIY